ncbi:hypothetical protein OIU77_012291 [Salix suchowensis]|uniref:Uncharacterized protein n=1 Tax=Salix suchowensis TaxID=1278906 RepID=A0ABQ9A3B8_9ROSI|nr:hypothetical protein OIU77_012291 [Salix suchowensis]
MQVQNPSLFADLSGKKKDQKVETELSGKEAVIDKELLEAFRFFDWNQNWLHQGLRHEVDYTQLGKISFPRGGQGENCASVSSQLPLIRVAIVQVLFLVSNGLHQELVQSALLGSRV